MKTKRTPHKKTPPSHNFSKIGKSQQEIIVQKYGGATLATPEKIVQVAQRISREVKKGKQIVAVVSAMGQTTNDLIALAHKVTNRPSRRELDMLLSTGERVSMALLTMSLIDHQRAAISFTGSQAGIMTDESHVNAFIREVHAYRVDSALSEGKIVVLAGFQGVSPLTKEITTLGRGGSDTTAVAMAAYLEADRCEILKDVPAVYTADPKLVKSAKVISHLNYDQMLEMTFWGAKVLHYRSVELAKLRNVMLYIGPAQTSKQDHQKKLTTAEKKSQKNQRASLREGTIISFSANRSHLKNSKIKNRKGDSMFESSSVLAINSQSEVLLISSPEKSAAKFFKNLEKIFAKNEIAPPQILFIQPSSTGHSVYLTAPQENLEMIKNCLTENKQFRVSRNELCSVSATCSGATDSQTIQTVLDLIDKNKIAMKAFFQSAMSSVVIVEQKDRDKTIQTLHQLIDKPVQI